MALRWLRKVVDHTSDTAINKQEPSQYEHREPVPILRAELQIPQPIIDSYESRQREQESHERERDSRDRWRFRVEVFTLVVLGCYTIVTYGLLRVSKNSLQEAANMNNFTIESSRLDQRAWVGPAKIN